MDDVSGLLAFISLIAAQFLAVVVAHSEGFDSCFLVLWGLRGEGPPRPGSRSPC